MDQQELSEIIAGFRKWFKTNGYAQWAFVKNTSNRYVVTPDGDVFSLVDNIGIRKIPFRLKPRKAKNGYLNISLATGGISKNIAIHRLVAEAFLGNCTGKIVHHKNRKRTDNRVENLAIVSSSENNFEAAKIRQKRRRALLREFSNLDTPELFKGA